MVTIDDTIKENTKSIKNDTYGKKIQNKSNGYVNGAITGAVVGVIAAAIFKWSYIKTGLILGIAGGYVGFKIAEEMNKDLGFKRPSKTGDSDKKSEKFKVPDDI